MDCPLTLAVSLALESPSVHTTIMALSLLTMPYMGRYTCSVTAGCWRGTAVRSVP